MTSRYLARKVGSARISRIAVTLLSLTGLLIPLAGPGWWVLLFGFGWISWTLASTVAGVGSGRDLTGRDGITMPCSAGLPWSADAGYLCFAAVGRSPGPCGSGPPERVSRSAPPP
ncbi:hypothetical protein GCM10010330_25030 [Streptomyces tendae]|uniref:hypothetical protein n=1 Tax=Streptomyces tendae TaxID=1932 RepID=UPI0016731430|nr:hypothetical protein [Streptomyces tendae]GHA71209.1 hypothetical protein GCM10010330_25030 [Streptomyces tendae]